MRKKTKCREFVIPLRGNKTFLVMKYVLIFLLVLNLNAFSDPLTWQVAGHKKVENASRQIAEQTKVKGIVRDARGNALPGVSVLLKGTTIGVVTDTAGRFVLPVADRKNVVLVFSFIGMKSQEVIVPDFVNVSPKNHQ